MSSSDMTPSSLPIPDDRGRAKFFHGRTKELQAFQDICKKAREDKGGTIFLVQGAPGAGKTALLLRCAERVGTGRNRWRVAEISSRALHDPKDLARDLGESYVTTTHKHTEYAGKAGASVVAELSGQRTQGRKREYAGQTVQEILQEAASRRGLILILDEVQRLRRQAKSLTDAGTKTADCLDWIHNGRLGVPVMLLAGGLGISEKILGTLDVSRFKNRCLHQLGPLNPEEAQAVIRDWLVQEGGASKQDPHLTHWINTLAAECHGWPQHLQIYAQLAAGWLQNHKGRLTAEVPEDVLMEARSDRVTYYTKRASELIRSDRVLLANFLRKNKENERLEYHDLIAVFSGNRPYQEAREVFNKLLHKGVVSETSDGDYMVPIPSMHRWLVHRYAS